MRLALSLAERGRGRVEPNPLVGAVVVQGDRVVGEGWHQEYGEAHAEVNALREAGSAARGATVYVTLEPCSHFGKTPPCATALVDAGVARVVFAADDPNPRAAGGAATLRAAGIEVVGGVEREAAIDLNGRFFHAFGPDADERPWLEVKLALTLDARIADASGGSRWITGGASRVEVHRLRAGHDAIAAGIETVLADDPELTVRGALEPRRAPIRIVFDRRLRLPLESKLVRSASVVPVWVVCAPDAAGNARELRDAGVRLVEAPHLEAALRLLRSDGIASLLVEGGGRLASAMIDADLVDRLSLFYAPVMVGPSGVPAFGALRDSSLPEARRWRHVRTDVLGSDTLVVLGR